MQENAMSENMNRQWLLAARPEGMLNDGNFKQTQTPIPTPGDGEFLAKTIFVGVEPAMRGHMLETSAYAQTMQIGDVIRATGVAQVVQSNNPKFAEGDLVQCGAGFQDYVVSDGKMVSKVPEGLNAEAALSVFGGTGFTAYYGMIETGEVKAGDKVLISGAAGAVGNIAGQIAKIKGAHVIGLAGSDEKCKWLVDEIGFDGAINYKDADVKDQVREAFPDGMNVFFDNVGGDILDMALNNLALNARVVICGGISRYNKDHKVPGPENYFNLVYKRARMEGFIIVDNLHRAQEFSDAMAPWLEDGSLKYQVDIIEGFENLPNGLIRLFTGENKGKQLIKVNDPV
jgi:NADPH-dependent curcumin reductase CurA